VTVGEYVYCIVHGSVEQAVDGVRAIGDLDVPVRTVARDGLAAVISDTPVLRYEATRQNLVAHERVIEAVMRDQTPLPVRFGTIADSADAIADIQKLLATRAAEFDGLLNEMDGRVELGLKVFWRNESEVFARIVSEDDHIRGLRDAIRRGAGGASQASRVRLGEMVKAALAHVRDAEAARILAPLRRIAERVSENPVVLDRMILNGAFLVTKAREAEFDEAVAALDSDRADQLRVTYVGPVAPYNFVRIVVNWDHVPMPA
jgi:hypothetical protein